MKWTTYLMALSLTFGLMSCSKKEEMPTPETTPAAESAAKEATEPVKASSGGGYEPTADERVPGVTMSQEEIDKQTSAALANTPKPEIPGEASADK